MWIYVTIIVRAKTAQVAEAHWATKSNGRSGKQHTQHKIAEKYFMHVDTQGYLPHFQDNVHNLGFIYHKILSFQVQVIFT